MDDERLGIADVGDVGGQFDVLDEPDSRGKASHETEREDGSGALGQVAPGLGGPFVVIEDRIADPGDLGVVTKELRDQLGVGDMLDRRASCRERV